MKKNAMCHIAVGVLSTCLAGAALANGGPGDLCNSNNIHRSDIKYDKNIYGRQYTRTLHNTTLLGCVIKFQDNSWRIAGQESKNERSQNALWLPPGGSTTVTGWKQSDITYERAKTSDLHLGGSSPHYVLW